jgi:O-acetyl-ADP-ribose deacetylase (regulator of RNase III)/NAD-dependent SIR2 family protein deacetylase
MDALASYRGPLALNEAWAPAAATELPTTPAALGEVVDRICAFLLWERDAERRRRGGGGGGGAHGHSHSHGAHEDEDGHGHSHGGDGEACDHDHDEDEDEDDAGHRHSHGGHGHSHGGRGHSRGGHDDHDDDDDDDDEGEDAGHGHSHGGHGHSHGGHGHGRGGHDEDDHEGEDAGHGHSHGDGEACDHDHEDEEDEEEEEEDTGHGHSHGGHGHSHGGHGHSHAEHEDEGRERGAAGRDPTADEAVEVVVPQVARAVRPLPLPEKRRLMQTLLTIRTPMRGPLPAAVLGWVDGVLQAERAWRGVVAAPASLVSLPDPRLVLWCGDITTLQVDCIVNAANDALLGCFQPDHPCIDHAIHAAAGPQLRQDCLRLMDTQLAAALRDPRTRAAVERHGYAEATGTAKATRAYNLPARYVLHTVGPVVARSQAPTDAQAEQLASCYRACLDVAAALPDVHSIALCAVSTGLFGYPAAPAAALAVRTVRAWLAAHPASPLRQVVFNVFKQADVAVYTDALRASFGGDDAHKGAVVPLAPAVPDGMAERIARARQWLADADCVLVAGGAGLSAAAGLDYTDEALFARLFPAMHRRGHRTMYEFIGFHDWTPALQWGYLCAQVSLARFQWPLHPVYHRLRALASAAGTPTATATATPSTTTPAARDYFVLTSNADGMFERHGFDSARIYTAQGDYSRLQCLRPCRPTAIFPTAPVLARALPVIDAATQTITDPAAIPTCPFCGGPVMLNVRGGDWFLEQPHLPQRAALAQWLARTRGRRLVVLEVGAGYNTPSVVRWPCEEAVAANPLARLIRINRDHPEVLAALLPQAVALPLDADDAIAQLAA